MVRAFILVWVCLVSSAFVMASENESDSKEYYNFLTKKTIEDFKAGVELYNEKKDANAPIIKRSGGNFYNIVVKNHRARFTILNYLNDQMFLDDKLVQISKFGLKKTTWFNPFIANAIADDEPMDAETTKILLTALGGLSEKLEEVGMMCFSACEQKVKKNNQAKVFGTLDRQLNDCEEQLDTQNDSIKKYPSYQMVSLLHSTFNPEFAGIKNLIQKISETNAKKVKEFMSTKLLVNKNYKTCVEVMASGTAADGAGSAIDKGLNVLKAGGVTTVTIEEEIDKAQKICTKMEELKTCLVTLKKNVNAINTIKRSVNKAGSNYPIETLPNIDSIGR